MCGFSFLLRRLYLLVAVLVVVVLAVVVFVVDVFLLRGLGCVLEFVDVRVGAFVGAFVGALTFLLLALPPRLS